MTKTTFLPQLRMYSRNRRSDSESGRSIGASSSSSLHSAATASYVGRNCGNTYPPSSEPAKTISSSAAARVSAAGEAFVRTIDDYLSQRPLARFKFASEGEEFFFYSAELPNVQRPGPLHQYQMPTEAERNGDFSQSFNYGASTRPTIVDPVTGVAFPGNVVPADRISPIARAVLPYYPAPNTPGSPFTDANNFFAQGSSPLDKDIYGIKVDRYLTAARRASARYTYDNTPNGAPNFFGNIAENSNAGQC